MRDSDVDHHEEHSGPRLIGENFLHPHPVTERKLGLDSDHLIVDRSDWERVVTFFEKNSDLLYKV